MKFSFLKSSWSLLVSTIIVLNLAACGGGGDSSVAINSVPPVVPVEPITPVQPEVPMEPVKEPVAETPIEPVKPSLIDYANYSSATPLCELVPISTVKITTANQAPVVSKDDYLNASLEIASSQTKNTLTTKIRGRGNSSWTAEKKPYRLKLDNKSSILGMPADKDWAMLANYFDKTLLRNAASRCLGQKLALNWTPRFQFVELTMNGSFDGLYEMTEHVKVSSDRVKIGDESLTTPDLGYLIELDARLDGEVNFTTSRNVPYVVKSDATALQAQMISDSINQMETALFSSDFTAINGYQAHLDMPSLIDYYLIQELFKNNDGFWSSTYFHREQGGKIKFGPLWDFDLAMGNSTENMNNLPEGWWTRKSLYMARLFEDPAFEAQVKSRWLMVREQIPGLLKYIDNQAQSMEPSLVRNFDRWSILNQAAWPNFVARGTYQAELEFMKTFIIQRASYMDSQLLPIIEPMLLPVNSTSTK